MASHTIPLEDDWAFTQLTGQERNTENNKGTDKDEWISTKVPTGVHEQLLKMSRIPDPFVGTLPFAYLQVLPDLTGHHRPK